MPTIKEIADACGVSKPTVTKKLKELELWESHVNKVGSSFEVSAEAASAVAAELAPSTRKVEDEPAPEKSPIAIYEEYVKDLKEINAHLLDQLKEKDAQIAELQRQLSESNKRKSFWSRLLPGGRG